MNRCRITNPFRTPVTSRKKKKIRKQKTRIQDTAERTVSSDSTIHTFRPKLKPLNTPAQEKVGQHWARYRLASARSKKAETQKEELKVSDCFKSAHLHLFKISRKQNALIPSTCTFGSEQQERRSALIALPSCDVASPKVLLYAKTQLHNTAFETAV